MIKEIKHSILEITYMSQIRRITTIKQQVYEILRDDICSGVYAPGQQIQETELSKKLEISRSPIREALRQLVSEGLAVEYPNRGVFVKTYTPKDIEDVFDLRILLESYAIMRSGNCLTLEKHHELNDCMERLKTYHSQDDIQRYVEEDTLLHQLLIQLSGNNLVISTYERVYALVQRFRIYSLKSRKRFDDSLTEHIQIIQNVLAGNVKEADRINREHLLLAKDAIIVYLDQMHQD